MESKSLLYFQNLLSETRTRIDRIDLKFRRTRSEPIITTTTQQKSDGGRRLRKVKSDFEKKAKLYITRTFYPSTLNTKSKKQATKLKENREDTNTKNKKRTNKRTGRKEKNERGRKSKTSSPKPSRGRSLSRIRASIEEKIQIFLERRGSGSDRTTDGMDWKTRKEVQMMEMETRKIWQRMCKEKEEQIKQDDYMKKMVDRRDSRIETKCHNM